MTEPSTQTVEIEHEPVGDGRELDRLTAPSNPNAQGNAAWLMDLDARLLARTGMGRVD